MHATQTRVSMEAARVISARTHVLAATVSRGYCATTTLTNAAQARALLHMCVLTT